MNRILPLLLPALFFSFTLKAQKVRLSEEDKAAIQNILSESEKKGTPRWEREKLTRLLVKKYKTHSEHRTIPAQVNSACTNEGFETGDYSGWTLTSGNINGVTLPCYTCATNAGGIANITTSSNSGPMWTNGIDNCTGLPVVAPGGGNYSLALNDNTAGGKLMEMRYSFGVTLSNAHFTLRHLVVLQNSNHLVSEQPYYMSRFLDGSGTEIPGTLRTASYNANWAVSSTCGATYQGWTSECFDLTSYIGQNVTLQFQVSDCTQGGHYGYAYIDASCFADSPILYMCSGSNVQQIIAPPGYTSYQWYGPNNASNAIAPPNGTNDTLTITNGQIGDVYYLKDSTTTPNGCYGTDSVILQITNPMWVNYTGSHVGTIADTGTIALCQGDTLILNASGVSTYTWTGGVTNGVAFYPTTSATYTLAGNSSPGCTDTVIVHTVVQPCGTTGVNNVSGRNGLEVYPNPSGGVFTVRSKSKMDEIKISDLTGRILLECRPGALSTPIQLEAEGVYFVQVRSGNKVSNAKIIVSR